MFWCHFHSGNIITKRESIKCNRDENHIKFRYHRFMFVTGYTVLIKASFRNPDIKTDVN